MVKKRSWGKFNQDMNPQTQSSEVSRGKDLFFGRVTDVCIDDQSTLFVSGDYTTIGAVSFEFIENGTPSSFLAYPLSPFIKSYPLVNEIIVIIQAPDQDAQSRPESKKFYYTSVTNIWNNPEYNALPNTLQTKYTNKVGDDELPNPPDLDPNAGSGGNYVERGDVKNLKNFPGDLVLQGRNANSIRLGSTQYLSGTTLQNTYSSNKLTGSPIMILRNGQSIPTTLDNPLLKFTNTVENINKDPSSFYLTTNQIIPINEIAFTTTNYLTSAPTSLKSFKGPQAIISSQRIVFSAREDSIILDAKKSISINSNGSINLSTGNLVVGADTILLGGTNAKSPVVKGEQLLLILQNLLEAMESFSDAFTTKLTRPGGAIGQIVKPLDIDGVPLGTEVVVSDQYLESQASSLTSVIKKIRKEMLATLTSRTVKTS